MHCIHKMNMIKRVGGLGSCNHRAELTGIFRLVVQKLRRESAHAQYFQFKIPTKRARMRGFSSQFLDNQPKNSCTHIHMWLHWLHCACADLHSSIHLVGFVATPQRLSRCQFCRISAKIKDALAVPRLYLERLATPRLVTEVTYYMY